MLNDFLRIAQELGLYAIVRPSPPYLCRVGMRWTPRSVDEGRAEKYVRVILTYLKHLDEYYASLLFRN